MDEITKRDLLSKVNTQTRRRVIRSIGVGLTGIGAGVTGVSARSNEGSSDDYDRRMVPGNRDLGKNVAITNDVPAGRTVTLRIRRRTPGRTDPVLVEREYTVPAPSASSDEFPNVVHDSTAVDLGSPGEFVAEVETDAGRRASVDFRNGAGRIKANQSISIGISPADLEIDTTQA